MLLEDISLLPLLDSVAEEGNFLFEFNGGGLVKSRGEAAGGSHHSCSISRCVQQGHEVEVHKFRCGFVGVVR